MSMHILKFYFEFPPTLPNAINPNMATVEEVRQGVEPTAWNWIHVSLLGSHCDFN